MIEGIASEERVASARKILLHGTAQVTPASNEDKSNEGKSKKAKGKSEDALRAKNFFTFPLAFFVVYPF